MKSSKLKFSFLTLALLVLAGLAVAANTGTVKGKVTDKKDGSALVGVNVQIEGTELGGATDAEGRYEVINVPAGTYKVSATYMGYNPEKVTNVLVVQDNIATVDFQLAPTVLNVGPEIVITANKWTPVNRITTSVEHVITDQDFKRLPVTNLSDLVGMQAGVSQTHNTGWTHIRGGRFDDVAYLVDGVAAQDALVGTLWSSPKPTSDALQSVVVITGGFDAEYGSAMSGIIKAVTKEGGEKTSGHLAYTTDDFFPQNTGYNYGYNRLALSLGGPTPIWSRLRYFLSADFFRTADDADVRYRVNSPRGEYALEGNVTLQMPKEFFLTKQGLRFTVDAYGSKLPVAELGHRLQVRPGFTLRQPGPVIQGEFHHQSPAFADHGLRGEVRSVPDLVDADRAQLRGGGVGHDRVLGRHAQTRHLGPLHLPRRGLGV